MPDYWVEHDRRVQDKRAKDDVDVMAKVLKKAGLDVVVRNPNDEDYL